MTGLFYTTLIAFLFLCGVFILLILIQKGRGGGISSAFGGAGGNTAFGSKTGDVLTWATSVVFAIFLVMCVALNYMATDINATQTKFANTVGAQEGGSTATPTTGEPTLPTVTPGASDLAPTTPAATPGSPASQPVQTVPGTN